MPAWAMVAARTVAAGALVASTACSGDGAATPPSASPAPALSSTAPAPTTPAPTTTPSPGSGKVRIVAVEVAPEDPSPGGQYLLLLNGTAEQLDLQCWTVTATSASRSARVLGGDPIPPGTAVRLFPDGRLFGSVDTIRLADRDGREVDRTPRITDRAGDDQVWFLDRTGSWRFGRGFTIPPQVVDRRLAFGTTAC
jgi:hypothetical protein